MYDEEKDKKRKVNKPGQWKVSDVLMGIFGLLAIAAMAVAGFRIAKWLVATFLPEW